MSFTPEDEAQERLIAALGFLEHDGKLKRRLNHLEGKYLRGGRLEERVSPADPGIRPQADVPLGSQFRDQNGNLNELDVLFTWDSILHPGEGKSLGVRGGMKAAAETVHAFLYKLGALWQQFGLTPRGFSATTDPKILTAEQKLKSEIEQRARQANTTVIPLRLISDLEGHFRQLLERNEGPYPRPPGGP